MMNAGRARRLVVIALAVIGCALPHAAGAQKRGSPSASAPAPARSPRAVPFGVGETLTYEVSWSSFVTAGQATLKVQEKKPSYGSEAYYIVADGRPMPLLARLYDLYYKADTLMDVYSLLPQRASLYSEEGRRHRLKVTRFNHAARKARFEVEGSAEKQELTIDRYAQDALGALYVLRTVSLKTGDRFSLPICNAGLAYSAQITVGDVETVRTGLGQMRAWRLTPVLPASVSSGAKELTLWLSNDARRLPLKMQAQLAVGSFELTLATATQR